MGDVLGSIFSAAFVAAILRITTPLLFASLGALISAQAGVINIGLEGIMLVAAFTGATVGALTQSAGMGLICGLAAAVLTALLLAYFHLHLKGDLILGGIAINILGSAGTVAFAYQLTGARAGGVTGLRPVRMPDLNLAFLQDIPVLGDALHAVLGSQNSMTWLAFLMATGVWFLLYRMAIGKHLRAVGENLEAAISVGISARRMQYVALALSGALAGMGGIHLSMGYLSGFTRDMTAGRGYIALVTPALGGGTPGGTTAAALLFGTFAALEARLGSVNIPSQLPQMIPYLATIGALVVYSLQRRRAATRRDRRFESLHHPGHARPPQAPSGSP